MFLEILAMNTKKTQRAKTIHLKIVLFRPHMNSYDTIGKKAEKWVSPQCIEVRFVSLFSGRFITAIVVNPPERKLAKRTSVCSALTVTILVKEK